jgi:hypothetical protein
VVSGSRKITAMLLLTMRIGGAGTCSVRRLVQLYTKVVETFVDRDDHLIYRAVSFLPNDASKKEPVEAAAGKAAAVSRQRKRAMHRCGDPNDGRERASEPAAAAACGGMLRAG